jgi:hypothetical protein
VLVLLATNGTLGTVTLLRTVLTSTKQNQRKNIAGADHHHANECRHPHFIRPALFTFFTEGSAELKAFVKENLGVHPWDEGMESYKRWLRAHPGSDALNPVKLYWWILKYWDKV